MATLNVESLSPLPGDLLRHLEESADLLAERLRVIGERRHGASAWQRAARASSVISGLIDELLMVDKLLAVLLEASDMDSACLILDTPDGPKVEAIVGLLACNSTTLPLKSSRHFHRWSGTFDLVTRRAMHLGHGFVGTASLRNSGARAIAVFPLWARRQRIGTLIFAHSRPLRLTSDDIEPLEMLADTAAALLVELVTDERARAHAVTRHQQFTIARIGPGCGYRTWGCSVESVRSAMSDR